jgi:Rieske Fe-S protein
VTDGITRRSTLTGAAALGVGLPLLTACGGGDGDTATEPDTKAGETLGPSKDVPVGGGTIYADQKVVVTQPTEGDFKAFSSICTHQGCPVSNVDGGTINCTCHGSKFSITDGSVVNGPATSGLSAVAVSVEGGSVVTD